MQCSKKIVSMVTFVDPWPLGTHTVSVGGSEGISLITTSPFLKGLFRVAGVLSVASTSRPAQGKPPATPPMTRPTHSCPKEHNDGNQNDLGCTRGEKKKKGTHTATHTNPDN